MKSSSKKRNMDGSPSTSKEKIGSASKKNKYQNRMQKAELQRKLLSAGGIAVLLIIFALCVIFMGQLYVISHLDNEVTELQKTYDSIIGLNQSREGKIIENYGYPQIEAMAASYGMRSPSETQLVTEHVTVQQIDESDWNKAKWYHRFFQ